jgi:hypothetical protein
MLMRSPKCGTRDCNFFNFQIEANETSQFICVSKAGGMLQHSNDNSEVSESSVLRYITFFQLAISYPFSSRSP